MLVQDVMTPEPVTVRIDSTVKGALILLADHGVTSLPVVDAAGRIRGVVSEADLIREAVARDPRLRETPLPRDRTDAPDSVADVYTPHAVSVRGRDDLADAVELMTSTSVKSLPVVDADDRVVGIVSRSDVVRLLARADSAIGAEVADLLRSLGHDSWLVEVQDGVVELSGPRGHSEAAIARVTAGSVGGVIEVRVDQQP
ncbi:HPP family protein [Nocardioides sp. cx-173]|uniref:CBS domain-containing protein n=1 Tax=Nocardioides sp. cx-173 TaxID=2898796 RepID=UPI001E59DB36|nr:CBS domain-containing protein [Nocardioides sp. cx-173]MCD4524978.1 CBS domain-containing protein [Nocardioides sp. cx-173]UGB40314.1 CBS domain-containing protein [Nocardioides sp. cx-173]